MKKNFGFGMAALGALAALGAVTVAVIKKRKDEEIYREAELKAMQELDDMIAADELMAEDDKCEGCTCAEDCAACEAEEAACDCCEADHGYNDIGKFFMQLLENHHSQESQCQGEEYILIGKGPESPVSDAVVGQDDRQIERNV